MTNQLTMTVYFQMDLFRELSLNYDEMRMEEKCQEQLTHFVVWWVDFFFLFLSLLISLFLFWFLTEEEKMVARIQHFFICSCPWNKNRSQIKERNERKKRMKERKMIELVLVTGLTKIQISLTLIVRDLFLEINPRVRDFSLD